MITDYADLEELFVTSPEPKFTSKFLLQYPLVPDADSLRKFLAVQLKSNEFSIYQSEGGDSRPEQGYYIVVRLAKTIFVRQGGMFKYEGKFPRIYEIKTDGDFHRLNYQLERTARTIESTELKKKTIPFAEIDVTSFDFVEGEDEEEFQRRGEVIRNFIMNYEDKKSPTFPDLALKHPPTRKIVPPGKIRVK